MQENTSKAAILTVSDTRRPDNDVSGQRLLKLLSTSGFEVVEKLVVTDELQDICDALLALAQRGDISLIITTGGTGLGPRDNTPEATSAVIEREAVGLAEAMRRETAARTPNALLSRGICGVRGKMLIINLPGSPKGVEECFEVIRPVLRHAIDVVTSGGQH